jgi:hypothetical protein
MMERVFTRRSFAWVFMVVVGALACLAFEYRPDLAIRVGTASVSETLCAGVFVSGLDADRVFNEEIRPQRGLQILLKRLRYRVGKERRRVITTWAGHFESVATFRMAYGCTLGTKTGPIPGNGRMLRKGWSSLGTRS